MKTEWKYVYLDGSKTKYEVSSDGQIRNSETNHYLSTNTIDKYGYVQVCLSHNSKKYVRTLHTIVARAFIPNPENKTQVNHKDGNKLHNYVDNLEWVTPKENIVHSYKHGLHDNVAIGENHGLNEYTEKQIIKVCEFLEQGELSIIEISKITSVPQSTIHDILNKKYWIHISKNYKIDDYRDKQKYKYYDKKVHDKVKELANKELSTKKVRKKLNLPYTVELYSLIRYYVKKYEKSLKVKK